MSDDRPYRVVTDSVAGPVAYYPLRGQDGFTLTACGASAQFRLDHRDEPVADGVVAGVPVVLRSGPRGRTRRSFRATASLGGARYVLMPTSVASAVLRKDEVTVARLWQVGRVRRVTWRHQPMPADVAVCHSLACFAGVGAAGVLARGIGVLLDLSPWP